ncbi:MAG: HDOD domain-containing protein [Myxococcales bacterium]|nr:MAG: HDOD domain-containing protein [Myxococcales bacterium]
MILQEMILQKVTELPTLPRVAMQILPLLGNNRSGAADFERAIRHDPALTANLLRLANSAYFGYPRKISSIRSAITLMGPRRVYDLAVAAAMTKVIPPTLPGYRLHAETFWQHSVAVAIFAERLAREVAAHQPDQTFTAGLLHDIGKLVISAFLVERSSDLSEHLIARQQTLVDAEHNILGADHADVGGAIVESWNLPREISEVCRWHHDPSSAPDLADRTLVDLVHLANGLAHLLGYGADVGELARKIDGQAADRLGIKVNRLEAIAGATQEEIVEMGALFQAKGGD